MNFSVATEFDKIFSKIYEQLPAYYPPGHKRLMSDVTSAVPVKFVM